MKQFIAIIILGILVSSCDKIVVTTQCGNEVEVSNFDNAHDAVRYAKGKRGCNASVVKIFDVLGGAQRDTIYSRINSAR